MSDRDDVLAILSASFTATDRRDHEAKHRFFTADAVMRHGDGEGTEVRGLQAIAANTKRVAEHFTTMHALSNWDIAVDGDEAQAVSHAIAHVLDADGARMLIRGLRYDDRLVRTGAGWRIAERRHNLLWQLEVDAATPRSLFEYLP